MFYGYTALGKTTHIGAGWADNDDSGFPVRPASSSPRPVSPVHTETGTSLIAATDLQDRSAAGHRDTRT